MKLYNELAPYYFTIEEQHRDIHDEITFIRSYFPTGMAPRLLDLGCGSGEHLQLLSRYGVDCVGIDSSREMIRVAQDRFGTKIDFRVLDMRQIDYYEEFDVIISLYGTFNYLLTDSDIETSLWNSFRALKAGGRGIFEVWNDVPVRKIGQKEQSYVSTSRQESVVIQRERGFRLLEGMENQVEVNFRYKIREEGDSRIVPDRHIMRIFGLEEMRSLFRENGFEVNQVYSSYLKEPFMDNSSRMIFVVRRS